MSERDDIRARLHAALPELRRQWPIHSLAIFGSVARNEADTDSDLDVLVEFERPIPLSEFLALEAELAGLAGRHVDLVTRQALKPFIGRRILSEAVPV
jgi:predicted nucleotidyltransferase